MMGDNNKIIKDTGSMDREPKNLGDSIHNSHGNNPENPIGSDSEEYKNPKERLYDKIPISLKTLDIIIATLMTVLVAMMVYFIVRKYF